MKIVEGKCFIESSTHEKVAVEIFCLPKQFFSEGFFLFLQVFLEDNTKIQYHVVKVSDGERETHLTVSRPPRMNHLCGICGG